MSQTHAFVEKVYYDELESDKTIFTKKSGSMYSTIGSGTASQATPQGRHQTKQYLQLILTNAVRIYYIMVNLIIVFLLYLIK